MQDKMKRYAVLLAASMAALLGLAVPTTSAEAAPSRAPSTAATSLLAAKSVGGDYSRTVCHQYANDLVKTCFKVEWSRQADGDGSKLEYFFVDTPLGCNRLEDSGGKYRDVDILWVNADWTNVHDTWSWASQDCSWGKDVEAVGKDKGNMVASFVATARVNAGDDRRVFIRIELQADGGSSISTVFDQSA